MIIENKDQPAFAQSCEQYGGKANVFPGLSKREYFAAIAMQGLLSNQFMGIKSCDELSEIAILQTDSLLKQLDK